MGVEGNGGDLTALAEALFSGRSTEGDRDRIAVLVDSEPAPREEFLKLLIVHRLLPLALEDDAHADQFLGSLRTRILAERDASRFVKGSRHRIVRAQAARRTRRLLIAAAALFLAGLSFWWIALRPPEETVASLERLEGNVWILTDGAERPAEGRTELAPGQGIRTGGGRSRAALRFPDGTNVELGAETVVRGASDRPKRLFVARGAVAVDAAPQGPHGPMTLATPHGEARVLGTTLRLRVTSDATRLEVTSGKVRLTRSGDRRQVDVVGGQYAVAAIGVELVARSVAPVASAGRALLAGMPPHSWRSVANTGLRGVLPDRVKFAKIYETGNPGAIVEGWSGGAFDTRRNRLLVWGGGTNYPGNEIYAFNVDSLAWERLTDPSPKPSERGQSNPDGTPNARATYNGLAYLAHADVFFASGGDWTRAPRRDGEPADITWCFDFASKRWTNRNPSGERPRTYAGNNCSYDPETRKLWWGETPQSGRGLYSYDYDANRWTRHNSDEFYYYTSTVDTKRGLLVCVGRGEVFAYDLRRGNFVRQAWKTSGGDPFIAKSNPGLEYDPAADRIVGWAGGPVYALDPDSKTWTVHDAPGAPEPTPLGIYGRWRHVPGAGAFVVVTSIDRDVSFYKLGK